MEYSVVDVFTNKPLKGNPVAVVYDGSKYTTEQMQQITNWLNLSETTFILPPEKGGDFRMRIFTPIEELPFAGHPTLGTTHAVIEKGIVDKSKKDIVMECERGLINLNYNQKGQLQFKVNNFKSNLVDIKPEDLTKCFPNLHPIGNVFRVDIGPKWVVVEVSDSAEQLINMKPNYTEVYALHDKLNATGFCVFTGSNDIEMRTFAYGVEEDPVCGSGNAAVAHFRREKMNGKGYNSSQGGALNRAGKITIAYGENDTVYVGGNCTTVINGTLNV